MCACVVGVCVGMCRCVGGVGVCRCVVGVCVGMCRCV